MIIMMTELPSHPTHHPATPGSAVSLPPVIVCSSYVYDFNTQLKYQALPYFIRSIYPTPSLTPDPSGLQWPPPLTFSFLSATSGQLVIQHS